MPALLYLRDLRNKLIALAKNKSPGRLHIRAYSLNVAICMHAHIVRLMLALHQAYNDYPIHTAEFSLKYLTARQVLLHFFRNRQIQLNYIKHVSSHDFLVIRALKGHVPASTSPI